MNNKDLLKIINYLKILEKGKAIDSFLIFSNENENSEIVVRVSEEYLNQVRLNPQDWLIQGLEDVMTSLTCICNRVCNKSVISLDNGTLKYYCNNVIITFK